MQRAPQLQRHAKQPLNGLNGSSQEIADDGPGRPRNSPAFAGQLKRSSKSISKRALDGPGTVQQINWMFYRKQNKHNKRTQIFVLLEAGLAKNGVQRYVSVLQPGSYRDDPEGKLERVTEPVVGGMDGTMLLGFTPCVLMQRPCIPKEASDLAERMRDGA